MPDVSETYAIQRPSGEIRACASLNGVLSSGCGGTARERHMPQVKLRRRFVLRVDDRVRARRPVVEHLHRLVARDALGMTNTAARSDVKIEAGTRGERDARTVRRPHGGDAVGGQLRRSLLREIDEPHAGGVSERAGRKHGTAIRREPEVEHRGRHLQRALRPPRSVHPRQLLLHRTRAKRQHVARG